MKSRSGKKTKKRIREANDFMKTGVVYLDHEYNCEDCEFKEWSKAKSKKEKVKYCHKARRELKKYKRDAPNWCPKKKNGGK